MKHKALTELPAFAEGYISTIGVSGEMRRRLLDLGFSVGSRVVPLFKSPLGDPTAYYIMGSIVALRSDEADKITVTDSGGKGEV